MDPAGSALAFAHRGGAEHPEVRGLENTLRAFQHAVDLGYGYLETDVHVTADGVLLAFHDTLLDRVSDLRGAIADLTHEEIRHGRIGGSEPIPTLAELFDAFPTTCFNIDLKSRGSGQALTRFLAEREAWDRVCVGSFSHPRIREFRRLTAGRVATSASPPEVAAYVLLPSARLANLVTRGKFQAFQIPRRRGLITVAGQRMVRRAHRTGKHVHVWTVDDPTAMRELLDLGVDALITDRTDILKDVLSERGQWKETS